MSMCDCIIIFIVDDGKVYNNKIIIIYKYEFEMQQIGPQNQKPKTNTYDRCRINTIVDEDIDHYTYNNK